MSYLVHKHKQGDTFDMTIVAQVEGVAKVMTGWSGISEVRTTGGVLIETLTVSWLDADEGLLRVYSVDDTQAWPVGNAHWDIQFTTPAGEVISSPTVTLKILADVSQ